jgi:membrane protein implicated in regulation of membrane protease activity
MVDVFGLFQASLPMLLLLAGAGMIIAEAFIPGAHFFVAGVALFAAGLVGLFLPQPIGILGILLLTAVVIVSSLATLYAYRELDVYGGTGEGRTSDSNSLRGKTGRVTERVTPTEGEVKIEGGGFNPNYRARSVDGEIAEGTEVMVMDPGGGNLVTVEPVGDVTDEIDRELERGRDRDRADVGEQEVDAES